MIPRTTIRGSDRMSIDRRRAFRLSFVTGETLSPVSDASAVINGVRLRPVWDVATIAPCDGEEFSLHHVEWHEGLGFVLQCYEDAASWSDFLITGPSCGLPAIEIELG